MASGWASHDNASNAAAVLDEYHGFHDADIVSVSLATSTDSFLDVTIRLRAKNHKTNAVVSVTLLLKSVSEYRLVSRGARLRRLRRGLRATADAE